MSLYHCNALIHCGRRLERGPSLAVNAATFDQTWEHTVKRIFYDCRSKSNYEQDFPDYNIYDFTRWTGNTIELQQEFNEPSYIFDARIHYARMSGRWKNIEIIRCDGEDSPPLPTEPNPAQLSFEFENQTVFESDISECQPHYLNPDNPAIPRDDQPEKPTEQSSVTPSKMLCPELFKTSFWQRRQATQQPSK